jgi:hypothetical protein
MFRSETRLGTVLWYEKRHGQIEQDGDSRPVYFTRGRLRGQDTDCLPGARVEFCAAWIDGKLTATEVTIIELAQAPV